MRNFILVYSILIPTLGACGVGEVELIDGPQSLEEADVVERFTLAMGAESPVEGAMNLLETREWEASDEKTVPRCQATTRVGFSTSALAFSGCPSETAAVALAYAWTAEGLADGCVLGSADCGDAALAAAYSASYWESILSECSLGEVAAVAELVAATSCSRLDDQGSPEPTQQPEPTPDPEPSNTPDATPTADTTPEDATPTADTTPQEETPTEASPASKGLDRGVER